MQIKLDKFMSLPMMKPYPEAETPLLSAMAGKKGGKRQTVREEAQVDTITMMNMFSCLQYMKGLELISGNEQLGPTNEM
jgi:hypothetical protein